MNITNNRIEMGGFKSHAVTWLRGVIKSGFLLSIVLCVMHLNAMAQLNITALPKTVAGGYNISCNGGTDGEVNTVVTGNTGPYTFLWSNSASTSLISGLSIGTYWVTVTDSLNNTASDTVTLIQPSVLTVGIDAHTFPGGTHISEHGAADGEMYSQVNGGIPPYTYNWLPGNHTDFSYKDRPAGDYDLTVTDAGGCEAEAEQTLIEPAAFSVQLELVEKEGGTHITCAGGADGSATATPTGGIPPYIYDWANEEEDSVAQYLAAGLQKLKVYDANGVKREVPFTLLAPDSISIEIATSPLFPNGCHTSCHNCANATLTASATGGISPYEYQWLDTDHTTAIFENAGEPRYALHVRDANGCKAFADAKLRIPERDDWAAQGNPGLDAEGNPKWLGTTDSTDLVIKANGNERLRAHASGNISVQDTLIADNLHVLGRTVVDSVQAKHIRVERISSFMPGDSLIAFGDSTIFFNHQVEHIYVARRTGIAPLRIQCQPWPTFPSTGVNHTLMNASYGNVGIGTLNPNSKLHLQGEIAITGNRLHVNHTSGNVGIGTNAPNSRLSIAGDISISGSRVHINEATGNVGIGTSSPAQRLAVEGTARFTGLSGWGTRMVTCDPEGDLSYSAIPSAPSLDLSIDGTTLSLNYGSTIHTATIPQDNMGNHTATTDINANGHKITQVHKIAFVGSTSMPPQEFPSPWVFHSFPEGFSANYRIMIGDGNIDANNHFVVSNGSSLFSGGDVQIGTTSDQRSLKINGNSVVLGDANATQFWVLSDGRYKKNIESIESPLQKLTEITGFSYEFERDKFPDKHFNSGRNLGFIAQDLMKVFPESVKLNEDGYFAVNYESLIPVVVEAIKEQQSNIMKVAKNDSSIVSNFQSEITKLKEEVISLREFAKKICDNGCGAIDNNQKRSTLEKDFRNELPNTFDLFQNVPNPFNESTRIDYRTEQEVGTVSIVVFDMQGKELLRFDNLSAGSGSVTVRAGSLYAGMFIYSLIIDNKEATSKRMILTK